MKKLLILFLIINSFVPLIFGSDILTQEWRKLTPLVSTCEDVKKILSVNNCQFPNSNYKFSNYNISLTFSTGEDGWNVSEGIVLNVGVSLKKLINLNDYEKDLGNYKILPVDDLPDYRRYINETKGIELLVTKDKLVQHIYMFPPKKRRNSSVR